MFLSARKWAKSEKNADFFTHMTEFAQKLKPYSKFCTRVLLPLTIMNKKRENIRFSAYTQQERLLTVKDARAPTNEPISFLFSLHKTKNKGPV